MASVEVALRTRMCGDAVKQGGWSASTNDRFVGGKPDMRVSFLDRGQLDIELKVLSIEPSTWERGDTVLSGITKLQANELRDMNAAGAPAVGMLLYRPASIFVFCNYMKVDLRKVKRGPVVHYTHRPLSAECVDFVVLMLTAQAYLRSIR